MSNTSFEINGVVSDGDFLSKEISPKWERFYVSVQFFSDALFTQATPSAGTATITASEDDFNYGTVVNGSITVNVAQYDRPRFSGRVKRVKLSLSGVTGATNFKVTISAYNK